MAKCDSCGTTILFGGVRQGEWRFCNEQCRQQGFLLTLADQVPQDLIDEHARHTHEGECPKCQGPGPVDVHTSHRVWSALVVTSWNSRPEVCCQSCGTKAKLGGAFSSLFLGWWGFPWGILATPIQIARNLGGLASSPDPTTPSPKLRHLIKLHLAAQLADHLHRQQQQDPTRK